MNCGHYQPMHLSQREGHGRGGDRGSGRAQVQAAALGRGLRHGLTALPNVIQKKGETKQALSHRAGVLCGATSGPTLLF